MHDEDLYPNDGAEEVFTQERNNFFRQDQERAYQRELEYRD